MKEDKLEELESYINEKIEGLSNALISGYCKTMDEYIRLTSEIAVYDEIKEKLKEV